MASGFGMHVGPRLDVDLPILGIIQETLIQRIPPRLGITTVELSTMPAGMATGRSICWLGIEAAIGSQPHQHANRQVTEQLCELDGIVPRIEDEDRHFAIMRPSLEERTDLIGCNVMHIFRRLHPLCGERRTPTFVAKTELGKPLIRPSGDNRLARRVTIVVVVVSTFGTRLCVAFEPR